MVRYLHQADAFFLHIPRTGGTAVETFLSLLDIPCSRWIRKQRRGLPSKHCLLPHYPYGSLANVRCLFTFVRHPADIYESWWRWLRAAGPRSRQWLRDQQWHPKRWGALYWNDDFNIWCRTLMERQPMMITRLYELYCGPEGGEFVNYIGRTESLLDDVADVLTRLGYGRLVEQRIEELRALNPINRVPTSRPAWQRDTWQRLRRVERLALRRFYGKATRGKRIYVPF